MFSTQIAPTAVARDLGHRLTAKSESAIDVFEVNEVRRIFQKNKEIAIQFSELLSLPVQPHAQQDQESGDPADGPKDAAIQRLPCQIDDFFRTPFFENSLARAVLIN